MRDRDVAELHELLARRDAHNRRRYGEITTLQAQLDHSFAGRLFNAVRRVIGRLRARWPADCESTHDGVGSRRHAGDNARMNT